MYFSGKITNSFFEFLNRNHLDTSCFFDMTDLEIDHLKDPHSWMEASQVESLLYKIQQAYGDRFVGQDLVRTVGHNAAHLNGWGGLESFLKLFHDFYKMNSKLDIFFSYFVHPTLQMSQSQNEKNCYSFTTSFDEQAYPTVKDYLRSILESLPTFVGGEMTEVKWDSHKVKIYYTEEENFILPLKNQNRNLSSRFITDESVLNQINHCEKHLMSLKQGGSPWLIDESLKIIRNLKQTITH